MVLNWFKKKKNVAEVELIRDGNTIWLQCKEKLPCRVKMYDLGYRIIFDYSVSTKSGIGLKTLPDGIYTLSLVTSEGYKLKRKIEIGFEDEAATA